jgi:hypothetical protein
MTVAAAANECKCNFGPDFTLADASDPEYLGADGEPEEDDTAARQALNAHMAEWFGIA